jgi:hypothetical protein
VDKVEASAKTKRKGRMPASTKNTQAGGNVKPVEKPKPKKRKKRKRKPVHNEPKPEMDANELMKGLTMDEVKRAAGQLEWSWHPYIPKGQVCMFVGPQGVGKSYLMAYLIAVFTGAKAHWPDRKLYKGELGPVILLETEGMRAEYVARMERFGVKPEMVVFPTYNDDRSFMDMASYVVDIARDMDGVEKLAKTEGAVAIIIDSLSGGHGFDEKSDSMRGLLKILSGVASRTQMPVIVVHHPRKRSGLESQKITIDRVRGSSTITQFCRSVVGGYRLSDDMTSPVRVEIIKASFSAPGKPFGYTINQSGIDFHEAPKIVRPPTALDIAIGFLGEQLKGKGPVPAKELRRIAEEEGISKDTLYEAKRRLGVMSETDEKDGRNKLWVLPETIHPAIREDL